MFSSRLNWRLAPNRLSISIEEKRRSGVEFFDLTESNPTRAGFSYSPEITHALATPEGLRYDPSPRGLIAAREAVSSYYAERGREFSSAQILLTASTSEAYSYLFKLLADPGDEILTPRPSYPLFDFLAALESVQVRQYPLRYDGAWQFDFSGLEAAITPRTRAIVVVNPNNPTGSFLKPEEWARLESFGVPILSDEVFFDYALAGSPAARTGRALVFSMSGLSKIAGLPQMKLGWIAAQGPGHESALEKLELIADTYLSVSTPVQAALPRLLAASGEVRDQIRERTRANLEHVRAAVRGSAAALLNSEGGWYAVVQVPATRSEEEWALLLLERHRVLVQPGFFFDFETEAYLVLSLLTAPPAFEEGVRRILAAL